MTRYQVTLRLRRLPWPIRAMRYLKGVPASSWDGSTSAPRRDIWFALLVPYRWRTAHHWWARRRGFFWLPCPLCGLKFGGHERDYLTKLPGSVPDPINPPCYVVICPPCTRAGKGTAS